MNEDHIKKAGEVVKNGGIIIFPTDTAFGIGCRIDNVQAIQKLFTMRKRPVTQATPVLFSSVAMVEEYVEEIPEKVVPLTTMYWPGALTLIFKAKIEKVPDLVRGGGKTIGTRIPNNVTALRIIQEVGVPILGPSANFHGEQTPYTYEDLDTELLKLVDYVVHGECSIKNASTVLDTTSDPWKIIRQGAVRLNI